MESNPFTANLVLEANEYLKNRKMIGVGVGDKQTPISLYMTDDLLTIKKQFSPAAKDMVDYICRYLGANRETIEIKYEKYCTVMGEISLRTFYRAKEELNNLIIVRKARKDVYYINPKFLFRGQRLKAFPDNVVIVSTDATVTKLREMKLLAQREDIPVVESTLVPD